MKTRISKLLAIGLTLVLLASLFAFAAPVSARPLGWSTEVIPSGANEVIEATNVVDIAVGEDGSTIYVGNGGSTLYKSVNRGVAWAPNDFHTKTGDDTDLVAVAPDDNNMVVVADTTELVLWITTNGGTTFGSLGTPTGLDGIMAIDVSPESAGIHYLAVAGWDGSVAEVWKYNIGAAAPSWTQIDLLTGFGSNNDLAAAVAYSPNFRVRPGSGCDHRRDNRGH
jgi:hypothetical protein